MFSFTVMEPASDQLLIGNRSERFENFLQIYIVGNQITDEGDFSGISRAGLYGEVVDFRGDAVAVLDGQKDRDRHGADDFEDAGVGTQVSGEDDAGHLLFALNVEPGAGGEDDVFAVPGSDEQHASFEVADGVLGSHGAHHDVLDQAVHGIGLAK